MITSNFHMKDLFQYADIKKKKKKEEEEART